MLRERFLESVIRNGGRLGVGLVGRNQGGRVLQKSAADDLLAAQPPPPPLTHSSSQDSQNTNLKYRTEILSPCKPILIQIHVPIKSNLEIEQNIQKLNESIISNVKYGNTGHCNIVMMMVIMMTVMIGIGEGQDVKMNQIVRGAGGRRFRMYFRNRE